MPGKRATEGNGQPGERPDRRIPRLVPPVHPPDGGSGGEGPRHRRYVIRFGSDVVGVTNLEFQLWWGETAAGRLVPGSAYPKVRDTFRRYRRATTPEELRGFVAARQDLNLRIYDGQVPLAGNVDLISEWGPRDIIVHVSTQDQRYWSRYPPAA